VSRSSLDKAQRWRIALRTGAETQELLAVWVASWRATYPEIAFETRCAWLIDRLAVMETQGSQTLCLWDEDDKGLLGFVTIDPASGWLDQICVHPERFGGGVGAALLAAARERSPGLVRLDVNADNDRAIRFYEREGFKRIGPGQLSQSGRGTLILEWRPSSVERPGGAGR
jgi:putative acetyltransferase